MKKFIFIPLLFSIVQSQDKMILHTKKSFSAIELILLTMMRIVIL